MLPEFPIKYFDINTLFHWTTYAIPITTHVTSDSTIIFQRDKVKEVTDNFYYTRFPKI
jgi:hypothetical protein